MAFTVETDLGAIQESRLGMERAYLQNWLDECRMKADEFLEWSTKGGGSFISQLVKGLTMRILLILLMGLATLTSCHQELKWNYKFVDRVIQNPDSLILLLEDTNNVSNDYRKVKCLTFFPL
ncbi:MAG: hypothetical protein NT007_17505 [Candidatus Kapabacteria bacterium]|nr:hypothetical protein [Candidatus Kapabacteria bacterium]